MTRENDSGDWRQNCGWSLLMNYWGEKTWKQLCIWLLLWDNLWRLEVVYSEEKEKVSLLIFFFKYILRSFFRKFQMSYQHWGFYLWLIWIRKQQLDVSNQKRISMALLTSKHSLLKNIQLFISAPIEKRLLLMLSSVKLEIWKKTSDGWRQGCDCTEI